MTRIIAATLGLLPTLAQAQTPCPTAADFAASPIIFTVDGRDETHERLDDTTIIVTSANGLSTSAITTVHGVHILSSHDGITGLPEPTVALDYSYPDATLPAPVPDTTWASERTAIIQDVPRTDTVTHTWGPLTELTLGACTYPAIPVSIEIVGEVYQHSEERLYLPDFGTSIQLSFTIPEGPNSVLAGTDIYTYTSIRN